MLVKTAFTVDQKLISQAQIESNGFDFKESLNEPTGNFFYDPWVIKEEYKNSVWATIINTLPFNVGEARVITLGYGKCYQSHGDIDDRYHLNIASHYGYIINLETNIMYPLATDGIWYEMDAGPRHSAANFGYTNRVQLVVRKLLSQNQLVNPLSIKLYYDGTDKDSVRFRFDDIISPWLNRANKNKLITDFSYQHNDVRFKIENTYLEEFKKLLPDEHFKIEIL